jgi:hypothetical protein
VAKVHIVFSATKYFSPFLKNIFSSSFLLPISSKKTGGQRYSFFSYSQMFIGKLLIKFMKKVLNCSDRTFLQKAIRTRTVKPAEGSTGAWTLVGGSKTWFTACVKKC